MASLKLGTLELLAAPYTALVGTSYGAWQSITTATSSLFLDGSVVSGEATGNREVSLQVFVEAGTRAALVVACEALIAEANKASNTITLAPDGGAVVVYEVFRADRPERTDDEVEGSLFRTYSLSFPALPFARSATRESASATSPAVMLENFEANFTGAALLARPAVGGTDWWTCPVGIAGTTPTAALVVGTDMNASLTVVTNATLTYPSLASRGATAKTAAAITATAAGLVEVRSTASWTVTGDLATVAVNLGSTFPATQLAQAGVEWLDGGGATLRIDWGTPMASNYASTYPTIWAVSKVPASAVSVRVRLRVPAATLSQVINAIELLIIPSTLGTVAVSTSAGHSSAAGLAAMLNCRVGTSPPYAGPGYIYRSLTSTDISSGALLSLWLQYPVVTPSLASSGDGTVSVRLFDSTGRWSRFWFTGTNVALSTWTQLTATLASPYQSATAGAASLTDVVAYDIDLRAGATGTYTNPSIYLDTLYVSPSVAPLSARGTVLPLNPILGSARTTAAVIVSSGTALTDWLVAAIDGTTGSPLLAVTTNVATVAAPAGYDGVYSILGCIAPATVLAAPTCTVVQKNAGVTVATNVLTGTTRTGNRYVDFGAVELPLVATPPENLGVSYTFTLAPASASWVEVLVIDVDASLAWVDNMATALPVGWIDEPDIIAGLGKVWVGTLANKSDARALALPLTMSRPLQVKAPSTRLLVYSTTTAPDVALSYFPRWLVEPS